MRHPFIARPEESLLLIIDMQSAFVKAIAEMQGVLRRHRQLIFAADVLQIPVIVTEHYKQGLGATLPELDAQLKRALVFPKEHFGACLEPDFLAMVAGCGRHQVIITGLETHICVLQTALDLIANGYQLHVVADAVASRAPCDYQTGLALCREAGAVVTTAEAVIYQWLQRANTPVFRQILPILK